jgi:hypothetical protein
MSKKTGKIYKTSAGEVVYGMMAEFATPADTYHAAEKMRDAGYKNWDVYSPFMIHGIDEAMGLKYSRLPLTVGVIGLSGAAVGFFFQWWVATHGFATVVQGKPFGAWQPFIPVTFEIGVLFTAFTCILSMLAFNLLPMWYHPLMKKERFLRVSDDRFVIAIEARDPSFDPKKTAALLTGAKGYNVELVEE